MYRAKESGRNSVAFFDVDLKAKVAERAELEDDLRLALQRNELVLEFQPKLCARTNAVVGVEALVRWFHPTRGAISPDTFIPIAEQSGSMGELGDVVLHLTRLQSAAWSRGGIELPVAVNVLPVQFESPDLVDDILQCLERGRIDPALIELEITETPAMFDYPASKRRVDELRATGVRVAIDDFGTGYSNLSQLARINVDTIKIDRSLVSGIGQNAKSEAMLEATINMARALGHTIVARRDREHGAARRPAGTGLRPRPGVFCRTTDDGDRPRRMDEIAFRQWDRDHARRNLRAYSRGLVDEAALPGIQHRGRSDARISA